MYSVLILCTYLVLVLLLGEEGEGKKKETTVPTNVIINPVYSLSKWIPRPTCWTNRPLGTSKDYWRNKYEDFLFKAEWKHEYLFKANRKEDINANWSVSQVLEKDKGTFEGFQYQGLATMILSSSNQDTLSAVGTLTWHLSICRLSLRLLLASEFPSYDYLSIWVPFSALTPKWLTLICNINEVSTQPSLFMSYYLGIDCSLNWQLLEWAGLHWAFINFPLWYSLLNFIAIV